MRLNIIRQQNLLNQIYFKKYVFCDLTAFIVALLTAGELVSSEPSIEGLISSIFQRYYIYLILIPILTIVLLSTLKYDTKSILICQTREVLVFQTLYRIFLVVINIAIVWTLTTFILVYFSNYNKVLCAVWPSLLLRVFYLWLVLFSFSFLTAAVYNTVRNKFITFIIIFAINSLSFILNVRGKSSLFYDFVKPDIGAIIFSKLIVIFGLIFMLYALLVVAITKRDFL